MSFYKNRYILLILIGIGTLGVLYFLLNQEDAQKNLEVYEVSPEYIFNNIHDEEVLRNILRKTGPEKTMEKLLEYTSGGSELDCHEEAHIVGRVSYTIYGEESFGRGNAACHSGYYHGAMEAMLADKGTADLAQTIWDTCKTFETSFGEFECLHGVGHGVLVFRAYDLPRALDDCDDLYSVFAKSSCYGGVFMENIVTGQGRGADTGHDTEWLSEDPHFPCNSEHVKNNPTRIEECYKMQTSWILSMNDYNFNKVAESCMDAPNRYKRTCFLSMGRDAAGHTLRDPEKILEICELSKTGTVNYHNNCIAGAVNVIVDFWGSGLRGEASELCRKLDGSSKENCYSLVSLRLRDVFGDSEGVARVCGTFEKEYQHLCEAKTK